jgi:hypothetical protein
MVLGIGTLFPKELRNALEAQQVFFGHVSWALPPQGQELSHWIQLLEALPY